jgi:uncharacterized protein YbbC (DUF1343 family)
MNSKHVYRQITLLITMILATFCGISQIIPGAGRPSEYLKLLKSKNVAVVANNASVVNGTNTVDTLLRNHIRVTRIFTPEHGFRGDAEAGEQVAGTFDSLTGLPIVSLYGKKKKPDAADLEGIEIVVFDLQDVGVRFYTYISTLSLVMEACAENGIPLIVFDRPNPNGFYVDGPVLEREYSSFSGMHPVPVVYGMTIGEYALMVNGEGWLPGGLKCELTVVPLSGYAHSMQVDLPVKPSPNLTSDNAILLYPSLCLFEGTVISVGRGTCFPFEVFGHPDLKGFSFSFIPEQIPGMSMDPPYLNRTCWGLDLRTFYLTRPKLKGRINLAWLIMAYVNLYNNPDFFTSYFDNLAGNSTLRKQIIEGKSEQEIRASWQPGLEQFKMFRSKYLLYP